MERTVAKNVCARCSGSWRSSSKALIFSRLKGLPRESAWHSMQRTGCGRYGEQLPKHSARRQKCRCELPGGMHSAKSAVLSCASGVLLNRATPYAAAAGHSSSSAMGQTAVPSTPLPRTSVSPRAFSGTLNFRRRVFARNPHHKRGFPVPQAAPAKSIISTVLPNTAKPRSKERMLGCWGGPAARIRACIMRISSSRALGAENPAAKCPRNYMEGSTSSTVLTLSKI